MHRAEEILNVVFAACEALHADDIVVEALKNTASAPYNFPALVVRMGQDSTVSRDSHFLTTDQIININILVKDVPESLDTETLNIREALHKQIMQSPNLGLDYVMELSPQGQSEPEYGGDSDDYSMATQIPWVVRYRHPITNPSV